MILANHGAPRAHIIVADGASAATWHAAEELSSYLYEITGANLKKLMEHPLLNGEEVNALYAFSGLKAEYAPWRDEASNVLSLALADGTEIDDGKLYTVAAWAGTVDESYVSSTVKAHSELGTITDLMTAYLADAGEVSPAKDGRITLNWEQDAA